MKSVERLREAVCGGIMLADNKMCLCVRECGNICEDQRRTDAHGVHDGSDDRREHLTPSAHMAPAPLIMQRSGC